MTARLAAKPPPFSVRLLAHANENDNASRQDREQLLALLPASYRKESGDLGTASRYVTARVERELDLQQLANIQDWLWAAGLPLPPRALHHQLLLGRKIFVTEQMDMHLLWTTGRMFLKPIPRFLLESGFWVGSKELKHARPRPEQVTKLLGHELIARDWFVGEEPKSSVARLKHPTSGLSLGGKTIGAAPSDTANWFRRNHKTSHDFGTTQRNGRPRYSCSKESRAAIEVAPAFAGPV
ncbi:hypothetical protein MY10362_009013 [Beauveria mimosiformis]